MREHLAKEALEPRLARIQCLALGATLVGLLIVLYLHPSRTWIARYHAPPELLALPFGAAYLILALTIGPNTGRTGRNLLLSTTLLGLYLGLRVFPLGDYYYLARQAGTDTVFLSNPLANVFYRGIRLGFGEAALRWVVPVFGFFSAWAYFTVCDRLFLGGAGAGDARRRRLFALVYLGSGIHLAFFHGSFENTQPSTPFLLLFVLFLVRYSGGTATLRTPATRGNADLALASLFIALASLIHGQNTFLLPAVPLAILVKHFDARRFGLMVREAGLAAAVCVGLSGIVLLGLWLAGFTLEPGHVPGHQGSFFVPIALDDATLPALRQEYGPFPVHRFGMFHLDHVIAVANALTMTSPIVFALPILIGIRAARRRRWTPWPASFPLSLLALGYLAFLWIINFHLGFPLDHDLMITLSIPLNLTLLGFLVHEFDTRGAGRVMAWSAVVIGGGLSWGVMFVYLGPPDLTGGQCSPVTLEMTSRSAGKITITLKDLPPSYHQGVMIYSANTAEAVGSGRLYGLHPDALSRMFEGQAAKPGSMFRFPRHGLPLFPNVPLEVAPPPAKDRSGVTLDAVAVFTNRYGDVVGFSNVARVTVK